MKIAPSGVKGEAPCLSEPRFSHTFPEVILGFDTHMSTSGKPPAIAGACVGTEDRP